MVLQGVKTCSPFSVRYILGLPEVKSQSATTLGSTSTIQKPGTDFNESPKKSRQCFTTKQVEQLEKLFREINYPDAYTRQMLAKKMKVSETRIQIWCQNRRAKIRRQRKQRKPSFNPPSNLHGICCLDITPWQQPIPRNAMFSHPATEKAYLRPTNFMDRNKKFYEASSCVLQNK